MDEVGIGSGLSSSEAAARLKTLSPNELPNPDRRNFARIVFDVMRQPMFALLLGGSAVYLLLGEPIDAGVLALFATLSVSFRQKHRFQRAARTSEDHGLHELQSMFPREKTADLGKQPETDKDNIQAEAHNKAGVIPKAAVGKGINPNMIIEAGYQRRDSDKTVEDARGEPWHIGLRRRLGCAGSEKGAKRGNTDCWSAHVNAPAERKNPDQAIHPL
ncbi:MAG TPA: cation-transporting P-type ATPase [Rhizomicrobium sp.]|nr:cation-transporting P-type ATPase [Rhizomicrobium sp.]